MFVSTTWPSRMTATLSLTFSTMVRSWVIRSTRHVVGALKLADQLQDFRLDGHVERGGRLVGDEELGIVGDRDGDHHALALAAGELMRVLLEPRLRFGDAHFLQEIERAGAAPASWSAAGAG